MTHRQTIQPSVVCSGLCFEEGGVEREIPASPCEAFFLHVGKRRSPSARITHPHELGNRSKQGIQVAQVGVGQAHQRIRQDALEGPRGLADDRLSALGQEEPHDTLIGA